MDEQRRAHEAQRLVLENDKEMAADELALVEEEVTLLSSSPLHTTSQGRNARDRRVALVLLSRPTLCSEVLRRHRGAEATQLVMSEDA